MSVDVLLVGVLTGRRAVRAITTLSVDARRVADGERDVAFDVDRRDEIGVLSTALSEMRDALADRIDELETSQHRVNEANEKLARQRTIISVLNRVLRHNLRNAIQVVRARANLAERGDGTDLDDHVRAIERTVDDLLSQAASAREIESLASGDYDCRTIDLTAMACQTITELSASYPDATFEESLPPEAYVRGHAAVGTAVRNIVQNALEHNDSETPTVTVRLECGPEWTTLVVADNGPGIPDDEAAVIEDRDREDPLNHSIGLGLWVTSWTVDEVGGELSLGESDLDGTAAEIRLSTTEAPATAAMIDADDDQTRPSR